MERDDVMLTCRVPREDVAYIDALAADAGCTRSEYLRRLLKLPVAMQTETGASLRTSRGTAVLDASARTVRVPDGDADAGYQVDRKSVLVLTDVPVRKLCIAIDRWGTNYNQAVRALNAIVRRLEDQTIVDKDDARDIMYLLTVCAQGNEMAKEGIDGVAGEALKLIDAAKIDMRRGPSDAKATRKRKRRAKTSAVPAGDGGDHRDATGRPHAHMSAPKHKRTADAPARASEDLPRLSATNPADPSHDDATNPADPSHASTIATAAHPRMPSRAHASRSSQVSDINPRTPARDPARSATATADDSANTSVNISALASDDLSREVAHTSEAIPSTVAQNSEAIPDAVDRATEIITSTTAHESEGE